MAGTDLCELVVEYLRHHADCWQLRNLIVNSGAGGQDSVLESGELTEEVLNAAVKVRREDPTQTNRVLAVSVQDDGEEPTSYRDGKQFIVVRVYDRGRGYVNIRPVRNMLLTLLKGIPDSLDAGCGTALKGIGFQVRSGHRWDRAFNIEYEALRFHGYVFYAADRFE